MSAMEEMVPVVDECNQVVAILPRKRVRAENLRHRATFIFVFVDSKEVTDKRKQKLLVQKRTDTKDYCPGHWDACTGGVIQQGEDYYESAKRELEEELGIADAHLFPMFDFLYEDDATKVWTYINMNALTMVWGGAYGHHFIGDIKSLKLQTEEVAAVEVMSIGDVLDRARAGEPFTPDSTFAVHKYVNAS